MEMDVVKGWKEFDLEVIDGLALKFEHRSVVTVRH